MIWLMSCLVVALVALVFVVVMDRRATDRTDEIAKRIKRLEDLLVGLDDRARHQRPSDAA